MDDVAVLKTVYEAVMSTELPKMVRPPTQSMLGLKLSKGNEFFTTKATLGRRRDAQTSP